VLGWAKTRQSLVFRHATHFFSSSHGQSRKRGLSRPDAPTGGPPTDTPKETRHENRLAQPPQLFSCRRGWRDECVVLCAKKDVFWGCPQAQPPLPHNRSPGRLVPPPVARLCTRAVRIFSSLENRPQKFDPRTHLLFSYSVITPCHGD